MLIARLSQFSPLPKTTGQLMSSGNVGEGEGGGEK